MYILQGELAAIREQIRARQTGEKRECCKTCSYERIHASHHHLPREAEQTEWQAILWLHLQQMQKQARS